MPIWNKSEIEQEVAIFRAYCDQGAPTPSQIPSDRLIHNDIAVRAFACGAELDATEIL